jgi:hypothetical protein
MVRTRATPASQKSISIQKRTDGFFVKAETLRVASNDDLEIAVFMYSRSKHEYQAYLSTDRQGWPPTLSQIVSPPAFSFFCGF